MLFRFLGGALRYCKPPPAFFVNCTRPAADAESTPWAWDGDGGGRLSASNTTSEWFRGKNIVMRSWGGVLAVLIAGCNHHGLFGLHKRVNVLE